MTPPRRHLSLSKKLLFSTLVFALFFFGIDRASKAVVKHYQIPIEGRDVLPGTVIANSRHSFVDPDATRIWKLRAGTKNHRRDILINEDGFRGEELSPETNTRRRILMIGDSCVFGWGVGHDETLAVRLSEQLAEMSGPADVINAGVPGYSSLQALNHLSSILETHHPDVVTIQIGWNDSWLTPSLNDSEILSKGARVISFNYFIRKLWAVRLSSYLVSKRYYEEFQNTDSSGEAKNRVSPAKYRENLDEMVRLCREHGAVPVFVTLPQRLPIAKPEIAKYLAVLNNAAAANKVPVIDLLPPIQDDLKENDHLFVDSIHFSAEGSRLVAGLLAKGLLDTPRIRELSAVTP